jgi:N6-L-threonylcarbamoyladenine synthase
LQVGGGGGPAVEQLALEGDASQFPLPVPMQNRADCDFSFSGLKTSVRTSMKKLRVERGLEEEEPLSQEDKANIAASFQNVAITHIEQRLRRCMTQLSHTDPNIQCLAVVGGVAANQALRTRLEALCAKQRTKTSTSSISDSSNGNGDSDSSLSSWRMFVPPPRLCTDQGAMSAWAAIERLMLGSSDDPTSQEVYARYPFYNVNKAQAQTTLTETESESEE